MRPVVIIGKREDLKMCKQIPADIMHHRLRRLSHNNTSDRRKKHIDQNGDAKQNRKFYQLIHISLRDRIIHGILNQHRTGQANDTSHAAEQKRRQHPALAARHINHDLLQVFKIKRGFQGFIHIKSIARQAPHPPPCCSGLPRYDDRSLCVSAARDAYRAQ